MFSRAALVAVMALSVLALPASAEKDWKYTVFDEWKGLGYVRSVEDVGDMAMDFVAECKAADVVKSLARVLSKSGWILDKVNNYDGGGQVTTEWKTNSKTGFVSFLTGISGARVRVLFSVTQEDRFCRISSRAECEIASDGGTWRHSSERELRNGLRQLVAIALFRPIYGDYDSVNDCLRNHAQNETALPTRAQFLKNYVPPDPKIDQTPNSTPTPQDPGAKKT